MRFTDHILLAGQIAAALSAVGTLIYVIVIYAVVKPIKSYIDLRTHQIQTTSNGGKSLPDIALGIQRVERKIETLNKRVDTLENALKVLQIQELSDYPCKVCITGFREDTKLPNITDPQIWDKLSIQAKTKWLSIQADMADPRCSTCYNWVCICGEDF